MIYLVFIHLLEETMVRPFLLSLFLIVSFSKIVEEHHDKDIIYEVKQFLSENDTALSKSVESWEFMVGVLLG